MSATMEASLSVPITDVQVVRSERITIVEHDRALQRVLHRLFATEGYQVELLADEADVLQLLQSRPPTALILDLQIGGSTGWDLCQAIIRVSPGLPFVVLSASADVAEKVLLLEMGADDYITYPFSPRELLARMRALIRRASRVPADDFYVFGDLLIDFAKVEVIRGDERIFLTAKEHKILKYLVENAGRVVSRDELLKEVWGYQSYPCTRTVDNHILRLRQKLEHNPSNPVHFLTVHCLGYRFRP
jgi:DNA-binding response OmpR family regulator